MRDINLLAKSSNENQIREKRDDEGMEERGGGGEYFPPRKKKKWIELRSEV